MIGSPTSTAPANPLKVRVFYMSKIVCDTASKGAFGGQLPVLFQCTLEDTLSPFAFEQALRDFSDTYKMVRHASSLAFTDSVSFFQQFFGVTDLICLFTLDNNRISDCSVINKISLGEKFSLLFLAAMFDRRTKYIRSWVLTIHLV